jgi:ArsR family transcriptional regulator, arsenate/arsenite/antimonite-responsive transcriptional repressor
MLLLSHYLNSLAVRHMELLETLKLLADETRFKIIHLLLMQDLCVGALAKRLGISDAAVSQHLQILRKGGLLKGEKRGYWTHYVVEKTALDQAAEQLKAYASSPATRQFNCQKLTVRQTDRERRKKSMCTCNCEQLDKLKESPDKCTPEQIKECHGDKKPHACEQDTDK